MGGETPPQQDLWSYGQATPEFPITSLQSPITYKTEGKITSYNYKGDDYGDTNSNIKNFGAFKDNQLTKDSLSVSPDVEKQFLEAGIKPTQPVELILSDGTTVIKNWDDRTMQDKDAKKKYGSAFKGRFDFNMDRGDSPHPKDNMKVVGFRVPQPNPTLSLQGRVIPQFPIEQKSSLALNPPTKPPESLLAGD